jgi:hypothetical protein
MKYGSNKINIQKYNPECFRVYIGASHLIAEVTASVKDCFGDCQIKKFTNNSGRIDGGFVPSKGNPLDAAYQEALKIALNRKRQNKNLVFAIENEN